MNPNPSMTVADIASAKVEIRMASGVTYDIELVPSAGLATLVGEIGIEVDTVELPPERGWQRIEATGRKTGTMNLRGDVKAATRRPAPTAEDPA